MGPVSRDEFIAFGHAAVQPGYDDFNSLYDSQGGELFNLKRAYRGAGVFSPLMPKDMSVGTASLHIDDLEKINFQSSLPRSCWA
jgi:hypothetical protein